MTTSNKKKDEQRFIARQWDLNAEYRFEELNSGQDNTYKNILCPCLHKMLEGTSEVRSVLDVGCGLGFFSNYLSKKGFDVTGVDMSAQSIALAQKAFPYLNFHHRTVSSFTKVFKGRFDACVANMLFHNVPNLLEVATDICRLLTPKGIMVGCIPHPEYWFDRRRQTARRIFNFDGCAYLTPFQVRGAVVHPSPFTYFQRKPVEYWQAFIDAGFAEVQAVTFEEISWLPDDLMFFIARKN